MSGSAPANQSELEYLENKHVDEILAELRKRILNVRPASISEFVFDRIEDVEAMFTPVGKGPSKKRSRRRAVLVTRRAGKTPLPVKHKYNSEVTEKIIRALKACQLTFELAEDVLGEVVQYMVEVTYDAGVDIIKEGDKGDYFYVIDQGTCEVFKKMEDGEEKLVNVLDSGLAFGELALIHDMPRRATVRAKVQCVCYRLHGDHYRRIVEDFTAQKVERYVAMLNKVPLMANLLPEEKASIAASLRVYTFGRGQIIIKQGDKGEEFFIVTKGRVTVTKDNPDGGETKVNELGEGATFGEASLLTAERRNANIRAGCWEPGQEVLEVKDCKEEDQVTVASIDRFTFLGVIGPIANVLENRK